jgi:hypothetical protein
MAGVCGGIKTRDHVGDFGASFTSVTLLEQQSGEPIACEQRGRRIFPDCCVEFVDGPAQFGNTVDIAHIGNFDSYS